MKWYWIVAIALAVIYVDDVFDLTGYLPRP